MNAEAVETEEATLTPVSASSLAQTSVPTIADAATAKPGRRQRVFVALVAAGVIAL
jgi:hypothetical protein